MLSAPGRDSELIERDGIEIGLNLRLKFLKFLYTKIEMNYLQKGAIITKGSLFIQ